MHELLNPGGIGLRDLVHDLHDIDDCKKVTPREVGDHFNFFITLRPTHRARGGNAKDVRRTRILRWSDGGGLSRSKDGKLIRRDMRCIGGEMLITVSEETEFVHGQSE